MKINRAFPIEKLFCSYRYYIRDNQPPCYFWVHHIIGNDESDKRLS